MERQIEVIRTHPDLGVVGCRWYEEEPGAARTPSALHAFRYAGRCIRATGREVFDLALAVCTDSLLIRRSALAAERFDTDLETAEDRDLWIRLFAANEVYLLPDLLVTYVQVPGGISRTNVDRDCGCMLKVIHRYSGLLGPCGLREQEAIVYRRWAAEYLFQGEPKRALPHAFRRWRLQPLSLQAWWIVGKSAVLSLLRIRN